VYTKFFGFKESPFNPNPDPNFLYLSQSHREALASMVYGIEQRRGFIAIIGEVGSGKTTLIHSVIRSLNNKTQTAFIPFHCGTYSDLLRNILVEFGINTEGKSDLELRLQFQNFVIDQFQRSGNVVLIFDEAQNMSPEVLEQLRLLSNLESPQEKLFQIILVGQPELSKKLSQAELRQLRQRIGVRREIEPLTAPEVRSYIEHRLKVAGYKGCCKLFSEKAFDSICQYSRGIPRMVNILCDNSLLIAYGLNKRKIDESIVKEALTDLKIEQSIDRNRSQKMKLQTLYRKNPNGSIKVTIKVADQGDFPTANIFGSSSGYPGKESWSLGEGNGDSISKTLPTPDEAKQWALVQINALKERLDNWRSIWVPESVGMRNEISIYAPEHPIADYPTPKPSNRDLWTRATLLSALLFLTIFLIQGNGQIGAIKRYIPKVAPVSKKMDTLLSTSKKKVEERSQVTALPSAEEGSLEMMEKVPTKQKTEEKTEKISLTLPTERKESLIRQLRKGGVRPDSSYSWAIQVYSSRSLTCAKHLIDQLKHKGFPAYLVVGTLNGETWYGVRVGFYAMRKEALEVGKKIASEISEFNIKYYFAVQSPLRK